MLWTWQVDVPPHQRDLSKIPTEYHDLWEGFSKQKAQILPLHHWYSWCHQLAPKCCFILRGRFFLLLGPEQRTTFRSLFNPADCQKGWIREEGWGFLSLYRLLPPQQDHNKGLLPPASHEHGFWVAASGVHASQAGPVQHLKSHENSAGRQVKDSIHQCPL